MPKKTDQDYLLTQQYANSNNLEARMQLHNRFRMSKVPWQRWVFEHFTVLPATSHILEVGCGPAKLWQENADRLPSAWQLSLVDLSVGMLEEARVNLTDLPNPITFQVADAQALPFPDHTFDAVIANHMLYHVPDLSKGLAELHRVLKPDGYFFAATNGTGGMRELKELMERYAPALKKAAEEQSSFRLDNGPALLAPWFDQIQLEIPQNDLLVTEAEPLVAYAMSSTEAHKAMAELPDDTAREEFIQQFIEFVRQEIATKGPIHITRSTGLFIARPK